MATVAPAVTPERAADHAPCRLRPAGATRRGTAASTWMVRRVPQRLGTTLPRPRIAKWWAAWLPRHTPSVVAREDCSEVERGGMANGKRPATCSEQMMTVADVAWESKRSERQVRREIASGELVAHRFGRSIRISRVDYADWLARKRDARARNTRMRNKNRK
jgi:hypothetical protein